MDNSKILHQALTLVVIVIVASVTSFLATKYYVQVIVAQELKSGGTQSNVDQNGGRNFKDIAKEESELKDRIQNFNEISGTVVEVGGDYIKIRPSSELLGDSNNQVLIGDYLRDRTVRIASDTRMLKLEMLDQKVATTKLDIADVKNGDYVMIMSKEKIGTLPEFIASIIQLPL